jgi:hypothetical protein
MVLLAEIDWVYIGKVALILCPPVLGSALLVWFDEREEPKESFVAVGQPSRNNKSNEYREADHSY